MRWSRGGTGEPWLCADGPKAAGFCGEGVRARAASAGVVAGAGAAAGAIASSKGRRGP